MPDDPNDPPALYIAGVAGAEIRELAAASPIEVRVVDGQPYSFWELEERNRRVHEALKAQGFTSITSGFDVTARGVIEAAVTARPGSPDTVAQVLTGVPADLRGDVVLRISDEPVAESLAAFGGMWMRAGTFNRCTSGWSVVNTAGTTGVTTAGHCPGINRIFVPGTGAVNAPLVQPQHEGAWGDVEWHTTSHAEPDKFYESGTTVRTVGEVEKWFAIQQNEVICVYGRQSNQRDCSMRVSNPSQICTVEQPGGGFRTYHRLVLMNKLNNLTEGDSGGGWSLNRRAYGSTMGVCTPNFSNRAAFSVADFYDEAIFVRVMAADRQVPRQTLTAGKSIVSPNGKYTLLMQHDGNLVLYRPGVAVWATSWLGVALIPGSRAVMQPDGNFVLYPPTGPGLWSTVTAGWHGSQILLQSDGNLVVYDSNWVARWASGT